MKPACDTDTAAEAWALWGRDAHLPAGRAQLLDGPHKPTCDMDTAVEAWAL